MKIKRQDIIDRLGEPDFSYTSAMYWYKQNLRAINKKSHGYEIQLIRVDNNGKFFYFNTTRKNWVEFTIQKKLIAHYNNFLDSIILGNNESE